MQKTSDFVVAFFEMAVLRPKQKKAFVLLLFRGTLTHMDLQIHILPLLYMIINFSLTT